MGRFSKTLGKTWKRKEGRTENTYVCFFFTRNDLREKQWWWFSRPIWLKNGGGRKKIDGNCVEASGTANREDGFLMRWYLFKVSKWLCVTRMKNRINQKMLWELSKSFLFKKIPFYFCFQEDGASYNGQVVQRMGGVARNHADALGRLVTILNEWRKVVREKKEITKVRVYSITVFEFEWDEILTHFKKERKEE